jgi:predicted alpha/beta-fold hydrolase
VKGVYYRRTRIETPDGDFLDLDHSTVGTRRMAVVTHGLEGNSGRPYVLGMVRTLNRNGWDAVAWNFRGCGGEPNRRLRFYHSGDTGDLQTVLDHTLQRCNHDHIALIGFSMGGNVVLKYLGERGGNIPSRVCAAVAFSVPCDLRSSALKMNLPSNAIYLKRFLRMLHQKVRAKMALFPGEIEDRDYGAIRTFKNFDDRYTAPLHGFGNAEEYWRLASSRPVLGRIAIPTLLVNALDDPILAPPCYPYDEARQNPCFSLETPRTGGHVGFVSFDADGEYWSERRTVEFLESRCKV